PFAPPTPQRIAPLCSSASQLIWRSLTSRTRTSSATAPRLPDANQGSLLPLVRRGISRFSRNERLHMPGSSTTPGRPGARVDVPVRVAFRLRNGRRRPGYESLRGSMAGLCAPLPTLRRRPYGLRRTARGRYGSLSFIISDLHRLLVAGLPAHCERFRTSSVHIFQAETIRRAAKIPTELRYRVEVRLLRCRDRLRTVMSSIMRRRRGLISAIGKPPV